MERGAQLPLHFGAQRGHVAVAHVEAMEPVENGSR